MDAVAGWRREAGSARLRERLGALLTDWRATGVPAVTAAHEVIDALAAWRRAEQVPGLWTPAPCLVTATLDDAHGQGIAQVGALAAVAGLGVVELGVRQTPSAILDAVRAHEADLVGLTVLWAESAEALIAVGEGRPDGVSLVAGGPAFAADPDLVADARVDHVSADLADFLEWLLAR